MIATICPNMSNSEHTLNTLRYADRVKELRGETVNDEPYETEDTVPMEEGEDISPDDVEETAPPAEEQQQVSEYPTIETSAPAIINIPTRLSFPTEEKSQPAPKASAPSYSMRTIELVARNHRAQIRLIAELCRTETKLLTDLTMRMGTSNPNVETTKEIFENYMFELDELLERKLVCIEELKEQLALVLSRTNNFS
ncbi:hypothetical protein DSO57_1034559 [Entomophthora muscae]|uniref:Uncharacterized protein n=1 Tax=Entomophthora muscae TaxID=34485 RepID=A0ACC2UKF0_9FUNG|nr:hypothetical protein DSO57_1034559 [Entomophthora muscae]